MRGLDESTDAFLRVGQTAGEQVRHGWDSFVNFAARDNVLEVALGLMSGISSEVEGENMLMLTC